MSAARAVRWRRAEHVLWRRSLDSVVVTAADRADHPMTLAGTGVVVWELLADPRDEDNLIELLAAGFDDATPEVVRSDVVPLLELLASHGIVARD